MTKIKKYRTGKGGAEMSGGSPCVSVPVCWFTGKSLDDGGIRVIARDVTINKEGDVKLTGACHLVSAASNLRELLDFNALFEGHDGVLHETEVVA